ncbi:MAG: hypothetical protein ABR571_06145 [Jatrophihabitans sp.]|uniref:hypothetical protein n=1 Tax=Jatrophihabitans sp. TaxID=1932789 RepID=UPI00390D7747
MTYSPDWAPAVCTLPTPERPLRSGEFDRLFASVSAVERRSPTALRLVVDGAEFPVGVVADLAAKESECCSFFTFAVAAVSETVTLDIAVPDVHVDVLDGLQARALAVSAAGAP